MTKARRISSADFEVDIRGNMLLLKYQGRIIQETNLAIMGIIRDNMCVLAGDDEEFEDDEIAVNERLVYDFIHAYQQINYKYTRIKKNYSRNSKYWHKFKEAAQLCKKLQLTPDDYITYIMTGYSQMDKGSSVYIPWPNQLAGETAVQIIMQQKAKRGLVVVEGEEGRRAASANRNVPLDKDERYQEIKANLRRSGTYTLDDLEYCGTRQVQVYGRRAKWVENYAKRLKESANDKQEAK